MITASAENIRSIARVRLLHCVGGALLLAGAFRCSAQPPNAFSAQGDALKALAHNSLSYVRDTIIPQAIAQADASGTAYRASFVAELMKGTGDYDAEKWYKEAIARDAADATYEFAYAQYLRVYRGALEPLFPQAEAHLLAAERKLACQRKSQNDASQTTDSESSKAAQRQLDDLDSLIQRAFVDLYQRDGVALVAPRRPEGCPTEPQGRFSLFESLGARGGKSDVDLDDFSLIRDLTADLLLARSRAPLNAPGYVTPFTFLQNEVREVLPSESVERVRFRDGQWPVLDVFLSGHDSANAEITKFIYEPTQPNGISYNAVKLVQYGFTLSHPFSIRTWDFALGVTYHRERRWGAVEYLPQARENINQVDAHAAASHFIGPDKLDLEFTSVNQFIDPQPGAGLNRTRQIYAGTLGYEIYRYGSAYNRQFRNTRGMILNAGVQHDLENYPFVGGNTAVTRQDFFASATVRALHGFDLNIQPTVFSSAVNTDITQSNRQYETAGYVLYRIVDEERTGGLPSGVWHGLRLGFLYFTVPFHYDTAMKGPAVYENYKVGGQLAAKWFTTARRGVTFLGSVEYDRQTFFNINQSMNLITGTLTMGF